MRTGNMIEMLAADLRPERSLNAVLVLACILGVLAAAIVFFALIGFRPDIAEALQTARFRFKFIVTGALGLSAWAVVKRVGKPGVAVAQSRWLLLAPVGLLGVAVLLEAMVLPSELWSANAIGSNAIDCLAIIPALSIAPLACLLFGLRRGAVVDPGQAGLMAGLLSSGIAATLYAANCTDDSPFFVLMWYPAATAIVALAGYLAGRAMLKW